MRYSPLTDRRTDRQLRRSNRDVGYTSGTVPKIDKCFLIEKSVHGVSCPLFSIEIYALEWATTVLSQVIMPCVWDCSFAYFVFLTFKSACYGLIEINALSLSLTTRKKYVVNLEIN